MVKIQPKNIKENKQSTIWMPSLTVEDKIMMNAKLQGVGGGIPYPGIQPSLRGRLRTGGGGECPALMQMRRMDSTFDGDVV